MEQEDIHIYYVRKKNKKNFEKDLDIKNIICIFAE